MWSEFAMNCGKIPCPCFDMDSNTWSLSSPWGCKLQEFPVICSLVNLLLRFQIWGPGGSSALLPHQGVWPTSHWSWRLQHNSSLFLFWSLLSLYGNGENNWKKTPLMKELSSSAVGEKREISENMLILLKFSGKALTSVGASNKKQTGIYLFY